MPTGRRLGYHRTSADTVMITAGCRPLRVVRGSHDVTCLLGELTDHDPQEVLARWAASDLPDTPEAPHVRC